MDLAFVNGVVWGRSDGAATALACSGDRITAAGSDAEIRSRIDKDARVIDARGGTIMPALDTAEERGEWPNPTANAIAHLPRRLGYLLGPP